jgi:Protein of unknown function (DUF1194)
MAGSGIVDVALMFAVDVSSSIDNGDFTLQMKGIADALRRPDIGDAIASGPHGRVAVALVQWSTSQKQVLSVPWLAISAESEISLAAREIETCKRVWMPGGTGMAAGLRFASQVVAQLPFGAERRVIDVSGDGAENEGGNVAQARALALTQGIVINGLPIVDGSLLIADYYQRAVIGGEGAFVEPAQTVFDFSEAMHRKLLRELLPQVT